MAMNWLLHHLETFVKPRVGRMVRLNASDHRHFTAHEMAVIKNIWRSVKAAAGGHPILLPGRDVWVFEVLARRENFPTVFRPDISRLTVAHVAEDYSKHFVFDTGFMGSIPKALKAETFKMASSNQGLGLGSELRFIPDVTQVFPKMTGSRGLALKIEATPKYWKRGFILHQAVCETQGPRPEAIDDWDWKYLYKPPCTCTPSIMQDPSDRDEFERAARLTIQIYTDNSPRFVPRKLIVDRWQSTWME